MIYIFFLCNHILLQLHFENLKISCKCDFLSYNHDNLSIKSQTSQNCNFFTFVFEFYVNFMFLNHILFKLSCEFHSIANIYCKKFSFATKTQILQNHLDIKSQIYDLKLQISDKCNFLPYHHGICHQITKFAKLQLFCNPFIVKLQISHS